MKEDEELEALLASDQLANVATNLELTSRLIGTFYNNLKAQGLPDQIITIILVEFYRKITAGGK